MKRYFLQSQYFIDNVSIDDVMKENEDGDWVRYDDIVEALRKLTDNLAQEFVNLAIGTDQIINELKKENDRLRILIRDADEFL